MENITNSKKLCAAIVEGLNSIGLSAHHMFASQRNAAMICIDSGGSQFRLKLNNGRSTIKRIIRLSKDDLQLYTSVISRSGPELCDPLFFEKVNSIVKAWTSCEQ